MPTTHQGKNRRGIAGYCRGMTACPSGPTAHGPHGTPWNQRRPLPARPSWHHWMGMLAIAAEPTFAHLMLKLLVVSVDASSPSHLGELFADARGVAKQAAAFPPLLGRVVNSPGGAWPTSHAAAAEPAISATPRELATVSCARRPPPAHFRTRHKELAPQAVASFQVRIPLLSVGLSTPLQGPHSQPHDLHRATPHRHASPARPAALLCMLARAHAERVAPAHSRALARSSPGVERQLPRTGSGEARAGHVASRTAWGRAMHKLLIPRSVKPFVGNRLGHAALPQLDLGTLASGAAAPRLGCWACGLRRANDQQPGCCEAGARVASNVLLRARLVIARPFGPDGQQFGHLPQPSPATDALTGMLPRKVCSVAELMHAAARLRDAGYAALGWDDPTGRRTAAGAPITP